METDCQAYPRALPHLYFCLPETPRRLGRYDRQLARESFHKQLPLSEVEAAFPLASVRRTCSPPQARRLGSVCSVAHFQPVIEEILQNAPPPSYLA